MTNPTKTTNGYPIKYNSWLFNVPIISGLLLGSAIGVTFNKIVHFDSGFDSLMDYRKVGLINHENTHCLQQEKEGWSTFLWRYLFNKKARLNYELEAMRVEFVKATEYTDLSQVRQNDLRMEIAAGLASGYHLGIGLSEAYKLLWP